MSTIVTFTISRIGRTYQVDRSDCPEESQSTQLRLTVLRREIAKRAKATTRAARLVESWAGGKVYDLTARGAWEESSS